MKLSREKLFLELAICGALFVPRRGRQIGFAAVALDHAKHCRPVAWFFRRRRAGQETRYGHKGVDVIRFWTQIPQPCASASHDSDKFAVIMRNRNGGNRCWVPKRRSYGRRRLNVPNSRGTVLTSRDQPTPVVAEVDRANW